MDKNRRTDDANDDLGVYSQNEAWSPGDNGIDTVFKSHTPNQYVREGHLDTAGRECVDSLKINLRKLTRQERALWDRVKRGQSLRRAARLMNIAQPTAQKLWNNIREKLQ